METDKNTPRLVAERVIGNGLVLQIIDHSRQVVGDRWQVKLAFETTVPITDQAFDSFSQNTDPDHAAAVRERLGGEQVHSMIRERNFIDDLDKDALLSQMVQQVETNVLAYVAGPAFAEKFLARRFAEESERLRLEDLQGPAPQDDDDGPADFADLFRD